MVQQETQLEFNTRKKRKLIEDILDKVFKGTPINDLMFENEQKVSFTIRIDGTLGWRYELVWDNNMNFEVWHLHNGKPIRQHVPTSTWFTVRDLLRTRHLDSEKLKW